MSILSVSSSKQVLVVRLLFEQCCLKRFGELFPIRYFSDGHGQFVPQGGVPFGQWVHDPCNLDHVIFRAPVSSWESVVCPRLSVMVDVVNTQCKIINIMITS